MDFHFSKKSTNKANLYESHLFADDPYYSGLRARIPNFVKSRKKKQAEKEAKERQQQQAAAAAAGQQHPGQPGFHPGSSLYFNLTKAVSRRLEFRGKSEFFGPFFEFFHRFLLNKSCPYLEFLDKNGFEFLRGGQKLSFFRS